jgi:hypothetical protein
MKKKLLSIVLAAAMVLSFAACSKDGGNSGGGDPAGGAANANSGANNEYFNLQKAGPYYELSGLSDKGKKQESLVIPAGVIITGTIKDGVAKSVTFESDDDVEISYFFTSCSTLETVVLPANLTKLCPLSNCTALKEISIPKAVKTIPVTCFSGDTALEKVVINGDLTEIGNQAFLDCKSLKSINFPDSLTTIGNWAFHGCESLTEITLPKGLKTIGELAFSDIGLQTVTVPAELELEKWDGAAFIQLNNTYTVKVKEGSWADQNFDSVFQGQVTKEYY